ncbi:homeobox-containing protein 1-like [Lytechinus variegatus]|uniref:homeobox-containing protein 1-like n=1 Tax=Lytechinus variegatus TaxID=7654 RepID=UPI001BB28A1C|nr:homeobox-containing protein 1-like [Lytechinus variegatus]XP_041484801.1 homeobox-containing protein 1-like [Lytechinus variegatus]XP_041484802.1 homeobox-containing protein 1-like [Lytechinus variegatus]
MSEPRYTIEQIELLRRLVRTGLTKDEIIHACDTMAKMDSELGPLPSRMDQPIVSSAASPPISSYHAPQQLTVTNRNSSLDTTSGLGQEPASPGNRTSLVTLLSNAGHGFQENGDGIDGVRGGSGDEFHVTNEEVEALFRKGHMNVKEDIKEFLTRNRLSQNLISHSTGISQSYISQFLLHGYVMRRSTQAILYRWYLAKRRELEVLGVINSTPEQDNSASSPHISQHRVRPLQPRYAPYQAPTQSTGNNSAANAGKRRERFVWKDNCLKVLEAYFKKNPYPNDMERIRLSDACNAMQEASGNDIPEHSRVNPSKVYNWFANRRKDANRKKRMAGETIITRNVSHDDDSMPEVDYIDGSSADLTNDGDMTGELEDDPNNGSMMDHMGGDDSHQDPAEVATQLVEVNNSIMTLMKAVEERTDDPQVKTEADT